MLSPLKDADEPAVVREKEDIQAVRPSAVLFCPAEQYRLERSLAWFEKERGGGEVRLLTLSDRIELADAVKGQFPHLRIEVVPYAPCDEPGYYSPEHLPAGLLQKFSALSELCGIVHLSGPPVVIRHMPAYLTPTVKKDYNYFQILHKLEINLISRMTPLACANGMSPTCWTIMWTNTRARARGSSATDRLSTR